MFGRRDRLGEKLDELAGSSRALDAAVDVVLSDRDRYRSGCFEAALVLHRVVDHGMEPLTVVEREAVERTSALLDDLMGLA